jgi:hypothetical protein
MKTARNDSCPCGSGKKYKKCCMLKKNATSDELDCKRLREVYDKLFDHLVQHAEYRSGQLVVHVALREYWLWPEEEEAEPDSERMERHMPDLFGRGLSSIWNTIPWMRKSNLTLGKPGGYAPSALGGKTPREGGPEQGRHRGRGSPPCGHRTHGRKRPRHGRDESRRNPAGSRASRTDQALARGQIGSPQPGTGLFLESSQGSFDRTKEHQDENS